MDPIEIQSQVIYVGVHISARRATQKKKYDLV